LSIKKQEGEVGETEAEETVEECVARVKSENEGISDEDARAKCTKEPPAESEAEKGLKTQILGVMKEYGDKLAVDIKKDIEEKMKQVVEETRDEMVQGIRKGLGLEHDPTVRLSEVEGIVRKMVLEGSEHGKRSETLTKDKPTADEDAKKVVKPAEETFEALMKNKGGF